jgi:hypothetical protein
MKRHININRMTLPAMFCVLVYFCLPVSAIEVGWCPGMYLNLGDSLDLYRQTEPDMPGAVIMNPTPTATNLCTGYQSETIAFAQSSYDLVKNLSINSSVSLNYLMGGVDVSASFFGEQKFDGNDLHFVFTKIRNFGTTVYTPVGFSSGARQLIAGYQTNWQAEALHAKITSALGSYYVAGFEKEAMVSVAYKFHFASASTKQQFTLSASGSSDGLFTSASFSAYVNSFFSSADAATSISYQFYSTDPNQSTSNLISGASGNIASYQQFTNFISRLEAYANAMDSANARITGYVLDPIQTVPGYFSLLGGYIPQPESPADYADFYQAYTALQVWQQRLEFRGPMSWLNAKGQQVLSNGIVDVNNYLSNMTAIATSHFNTGAPLNVPPDVVAYLANLSQLRLPEIYVMDTWEYDFFYTPDNGYIYNHVLIGRVDCGNSDLMVTNPFGNIAVTNASGGVSSAGIDYDAYHFSTNMTGKYTSGFDGGSIYAHLKTLFASEQWNNLTNGNPDLNGFFLINEFDYYAWAPSPSAALWTLAIYDPNSLQSLDTIPFFSTRSGGCVAPSQLSGGVNVSIASTSPLTNGWVGQQVPVTVQVTNQSPIQAYGTTVTFALSNGFDFVGGNGSQGYVSFDPATRHVSCVVGSLPGNACASVNVNLVPLQNGLAVPGTAPLVVVGSGLTNSVTGMASFSPIAAAPATIGLQTVRGGVQLDWWSDTDRMFVETSTALGPGSSWSSLTNGIVVSGSHRFLSAPASGRQGYFRLHSQ